MLIFAEICSGKGVQVKAPLDMIRGIAWELRLQYQLVLSGAGRIAVFFSAPMAQVAHAITFIPGARLNMLPLWIIYRHFKIQDTILPFLLLWHANFPWVYFSRDLTSFVGAFSRIFSWGRAAPMEISAAFAIWNIPKGRESKREKTWTRESQKKTIPLEMTRFMFP